VKSIPNVIVIATTAYLRIHPPGDSLQVIGASDIGPSTDDIALPCRFRPPVVASCPMKRIEISNHLVSRVTERA
jgi:hypothetical protein